ncbi:hypothetical protein [Dissulfuribacter thermophilus]|uniref:hypothetical protein n=1 Tax=Dissulfuribacter thermophilus TaxID=1156395 RepID=UPI0011471732|nr:hypothetical protein [Dissulfuribacter thermophilus]
MNFEHYNGKLHKTNSSVEFTFSMNFRAVFFAPFYRPLGLAILPGSLRCQGLEVPEYVCAPSALHLGQTRQLQDLDKTKPLCKRRSSF